MKPPGDKAPGNVLRGKQGQAAAEQHLLAGGYTIIARNFRVRRGEIDLIAQQADGVIVFIEVKMRSSTAFGLPREAVGYAKQRRIVNTALHYIAQNGLDNDGFRFDVVEVLALKGQQYIRHIENAFYCTMGG